MPEDLMEPVLAANVLRSRARGERAWTAYPRWKRIWIEPWFNLLGLAVGQVVASLPWAQRWRADQKLVEWMGARPAMAGTSLLPRCTEMAAMARRLHQETGQWPATMVFVSHPPTIGPLEWIRFELVRQGLLLANAVVDVAQAGQLYRASPQCFLAIDPFALDTVSTPVAAAYAGMMHRLYLVFDRQSRSQSWLQRHLLLRHTGYAHIAFRILNRLKRDSPLVMVLPGGLPLNARMLYTAKEFVLSLPVKRWPYSKRLAQKKWMEALLVPVNGTLAFDTGELLPTTRAALGGLLGELDIPEADRPALLNEFAREFRQAAPYRIRLFRVLFKRLVSKGKPLLWVAGAHQDNAPYIRISSPWGAYRNTAGQIQLLRNAQEPGAPAPAISQIAMDFSQQILV